jgi:hypothetical protein
MLIGTITVWATVANAGRPVSAGIKLLALLSGLGVFLFGLGLVSPLPLLTNSGGALPPTPNSLSPLSPSQASTRDPSLLVYSWDFTTDDAKWKAEACQKLGASQESAIESGRMIISIRSGAGQCAGRVKLNVPPDLSDVDVEATLQRLEGPASMTYGLIVRDHETLGDIYFLIGNDQQFGVFAHTHGASESITALVPWQRHPAIISEGPNKLRVVARERIISIYANDQALSTFDYNNVVAGSTGVIATIYEPNLTGSVAVDGFRVSRVR